MKYPKYLNESSTIGITASSCGVLKKIDKYEKSIKLVFSSSKICYNEEDRKVFVK